MKKLGNGWQVGVYENESGMVYKIMHSGIRSYLAIIKDFPIILFTPLKLKKYVSELKQNQIRSLKIISNKVNLWTKIGKPVIEHSGNYYQQKVIPIHKYIKKLNENEFKLLVDKFSSFTHSLYQEGVIDKSFNFLKNFGIIENKIILTDLGELFFDQENIKKQILKRAWSKSYVLMTIPRKFRNYFIKKMDETFNV